MLTQDARTRRCNCESETAGVNGCGLEPFGQVGKSWPGDVEIIHGCVRHAQFLARVRLITTSRRRLPSGRAQSLNGAHPAEYSAPFVILCAEQQPGNRIGIARGCAPLDFTHHFTAIHRLPRGAAVMAPNLFASFVKQLRLRGFEHPFILRSITRFGPALVDLNSPGGGCEREHVGRRDLDVGRDVATRGTL